MPSTIGKTYRRAALDDPTAHDRYVGSNLMEPSTGDSVTREMAYDGDMDDITDPADALKRPAPIATPPLFRQMSVNSKAALT